MCCKYGFEYPLVIIRTSNKIFPPKRVFVLRMIISYRETEPLFLINACPSQSIVYEFDECEIQNKTKTEYFNRHAAASLILFPIYCINFYCLLIDGETLQNYSHSNANL